MKYIKLYEASSNSKFSLEKINRMGGYSYVICNSEREGEDATFDEMIVDGKIDKEIVKMCSSGNKKMMLSVLKLVEKWPVSKLRTMQYLSVEVIDKPVKIYDIGGKEIELPNVMCANVTSVNNNRIFMTSFDKKPEFGYGKYIKSISMFNDMDSIPSVKELIDIIKNMNNIEKHSFTYYLLGHVDPDLEDYELKKVIDNITDKKRMKNYHALDIDGFDFFGDD